MAYVAQVHKTLFDRVWEKVDHNGPIPPKYPELGPCWIWMAYCDHKGYGKLNVGRHVNGVYSNKLEFAHRLTWELTNGAIPTQLGNLWVLHRCDNRKCVRPDHLFLGTVQTNNADRLKKGGYDGQSKGEDNYRHKLTNDQVLEIRRVCIPGHPEFGYVPLGKKYGVSNGTIRHVYLRNNWKHI